MIGVRPFGVLVLLAALAVPSLEGLEAEAAEPGSIYRLGGTYPGNRYIIRLSPAEPVPGIAGAVQIAQDQQYRQLALKPDGRVYELGDAVGTLAGLENVTQIAGSVGNLLALATDGTVWASGSNDCGQVGSTCLGVGGSTAPTIVTGLVDAIAVAAGRSHSLAVTADGLVWAWGCNQLGQLGNGSTTGSTTPVLVTGLTEVIAVSAGRNHSVALRRDGTVWRWGVADYSSAPADPGRDTSDFTTTPVAVAGLPFIVAISAGQTHSIALARDGTVWAWGDNERGQLGDDTLRDSRVPVRVKSKREGSPWWETYHQGTLSPRLDRVTSISAGDRYSLAVRDDGTVWGWGDNSSGQLGAWTSYQTDDKLFFSPEQYFIGVAVRAMLFPWGERATSVAAAPFSATPEVAGTYSLVLTGAGPAPPLVTPCGTFTCRVPLLTGGADPGSIVDLHEAGRLIGRAVANQSRQWEARIPLDNGSHTVTATATAPTGEVSAASDPLTFIVDFSGYADAATQRTVIRDLTTMGTGVAEAAADKVTGLLSARSQVEEKLPVGVWHGTQAIGSVRALASGTATADFPVEGCDTFQVAVLVGEILAHVGAEVPQLGSPFFRDVGAEVKAIVHYYFFPCEQATKCLPSAHVVDEQLVARLNRADAPDEVLLRGGVPSPPGFAGKGVVRVVGGLYTDALVSGNGVAEARVTGSFVACLLA